MQIEPTKHVLDRVDGMAPTRQHELLQIIQIRALIFPEISSLDNELWESMSCPICALLWCVEVLSHK